MLIEARIGSPPKLISCESYVAEVTSYASHTPALPVDNGHGFSSTAFSANIVRHGAWAEMAGTVQRDRAGSPAGGGQSRPCPRGRHRATGVNSISGSVLSHGRNPVDAREAKEVPPPSLLARAAQVIEQRCMSQKLAQSAIGTVDARHDLSPWRFGRGFEIGKPVVGGRG